MPPDDRSLTFSTYLGGLLMRHRKPDSSETHPRLDRRQFLATGSAGFLAAAIPATPHLESFFPEVSSRPSSSAATQASSLKRKLPIGVFDPVYADLSMDEMLDKVSALASKRWKLAPEAILVRITVQSRSSWPILAS